MTSRQSWAIFCLTKIDVRNAPIDMDRASALIDSLKAGGVRFTEAIQAIKDTPGVVVKGEAKPKEDWQKLWNAAHEAGVAAANACTPTPMVVNTHDGPALTGREPIIARTVVPTGVCGFASIKVRPANCSFALWLKKQKLARPDSYSGGMSINVFQYGQSYELKSAYAHAFAAVLHNAGIRAYADSRLD